MRRLAFVGLILIVSTAARAAPALTTMEVANPRGTIGEMGTMGLWEPGFHLSNENDSLGNTDKLVTQSSAVSINTLNESGLSFEVGYRWRLVTPIEETLIGEPKLESPIGPFIDWEEYSASMAKTVRMKSGAFKFQATLAYNAMHDNYGKSLLRWAHEVIGTDQIDYGPSLRSWHWGGGGELSYLTPTRVTGAGNAIGLSWGLGWSQNNLMQEGYTRIQLVSVWSHDFKIGAEASYVRQFFSPIYARLIKPERIEAGLSIQITPYWRVGAKYVSPYLTGDAFGQYYWEVFGLSIPF